MNAVQCEQHLKLIDVELAKLQEELNLKKNKFLTTCVTSLNNKIEIWKKIYRQVHNTTPTDSQVAELKNRLGIVSPTNKQDIN